MYIFKRLLGYKYIANKRSKEIHLISNIKSNCKINLIADDNKMFLTEKKFKKCMVNGYNGCRWCLKEFDKG